MTSALEQQALQNMLKTCSPQPIMGGHPNERRGQSHRLANEEYSASKSDTNLVRPKMY